MARQEVPLGERPDPLLTSKWLRRLALWMHEYRPERAASWRDLLEVLGPTWAEDDDQDWDPAVLDLADPMSTGAERGVEDMIQRIAQHTGLLTERASERRGFLHLTFQEYYVALGLLYEGKRHDRPAAVRHHVHNPRYREPLRIRLFWTPLTRLG
jgi:hypothetical protein